MDTPTALKSMDAHAGTLEPIPFDIHDDGLMHDLLGNDNLAKPVQALLLTLHEIECTAASFGVDHYKALQALLPHLKALREAVKTEWRNL
jgi:hypothetical protein